MISNPHLQNMKCGTPEQAALYEEWYALFNMVHMLESGESGVPWHTYAAFIRTHPEPEWDWLRHDDFSYGA